MTVRQVYISRKYASFWERAEMKSQREGLTLAEYLGRLVRNDIISGDAEVSIEVLVQRAREAIDELAERATGSEP